MKLIYTFCTLFISVILSAQQFTFRELIEMTKESKTFEIKMIKGLNRMHNKKIDISFSYQTLNSIGSSASMPTNNTKYEPRYLFDNGIVYSLREIVDEKLDPSYEIRNRLRREGKLINEKIVDSFNYVNDKIVSLIKREYTTIGFAENYNADEKVATTWYTWSQKYYKKLLVNSVLFEPSHKTLAIEYSSDSDFANILNQIIKVSKYLETKEEFGSFISKYQFNEYKITSERRLNNAGGIIEIYTEKR